MDNGQTNRIATMLARYSQIVKRGRGSNNADNGSTEARKTSNTNDGLHSEKSYGYEKNGFGRVNGFSDEDFQESNLLKSKSDTAPDESITPPKIRTTAQKTQFTFKLKEEVRRNSSNNPKSTVK